MAQKQKQKRPSPLEEPPTASSSDSSGEDEVPSSQPHPEEQEEDDDDEEEVSSEEQQQQQQEDEDEDEDDDDEEEEEEHHQPPSKNPPPIPAKPASSESDTASGSDSDSPAPTPNFKVKPIASKPMDQTPKANSKPQPSASKRPAENNGHGNEPKRSKKKVTEAASSSDDNDAEEDPKKAGADSRNPFQRLWSEEDELAILKGMVEFTSKTGSDPFKHVNAFHDFMKKSLHAEASSNQLKEKIRRLKKKYETNAGKGKNGQGPTFSKPHDQEAFELSKKVWGNAGGGGGGGKANGAVEKAKSNGKPAKSPKKEASKINVASSKPKPELKNELTSKDSKEAVKMDVDEKIDTTKLLLEVIRVDKGVVGLCGLNEDVVKRGMDLIGASERAELEGQWKELQVAELEVSAKRAELVAKQARLILEAYK